MSIEEIKKIILKKAYIKIFLSILIIFILGIYFKTFFTIGVYFNDTFLKKEVISSDNHYRDEDIYGDIHITVKQNNDESVQVLYRLPNNINEEYTVNFKEASNGESEVDSIEDEEGEIIFEGKYIKGSSILLDKNGEPILDGIFRISFPGQNPYENNYKISLLNIVKFATFEKDRIRGKVELLIFAVFILIIWLIDIKFPLFFFKLRNFLEVKDPEPSEFYIMIQRISWFVYPAIALVLLIVAIS
ncbi:hypothetical protein [Maledivibacter halophilus]|uniref:DUF6199 domain-containing protein n=1 Tax=Maledivibacter halophilus TaxID=36842 RepID=A0A1T5LTH4_9FIRM|nr:hypothetical protein [Maledivibacter halophilus]SKC79272.1 hypothetical protein SAMN02194393_03275 [Maledivibacter halophilus]